MQLPIIQENQDLQQAVDAKELYQSLGLDVTHWSRWHTKNIAENPFATQGVDFVGFAIMASGNQTQNYLLSIEFAKKLAMQVRTEMGERIRDYFLECERKASQPVVALPDFTNPALAARAWADEYQAKQIAQEQLALAAPKVAHYDAVVERSTLLNATQVAHSVGLSSPQKLNKHLEAMGVYNGSCKRGKEFRAWFIEKGLGEMKQGSTGHQQPLFTTKGQAWIFDKLASESVA
ncbi:antA/AntB antirepressor family protein [Psychrobacter glacincola]|uniref:antA/AntB antirepressor family protein n=1 Tax=Psychrobacter glacincola TaxID=56810 RepID=UPI0039AEEC96